MQSALTRATLLSQRASTYTYSGSLNSSPVLITDVYSESPQSVQSVSDSYAPLLRLNHPHVLTTYSVFPDTEESGWTKAVVVTELPDRDLATEIAQRCDTQRYWNERELVETVLKLCGALDHAQRNNFPHRDINPSTVYISAGSLKIGRFVPQTASWDQVSNYTTHRLYLSPEAKQGQQFDVYKSDLFSLGLTVVHMTFLQANGELADGETMEQRVEAILNRLSSYQTLQYCLQYMLAIDPTSRPSPGDVCRTLEGYFPAEQERTQAGAGFSAGGYSSNSGYTTIDPQSCSRLSGNQPVQFKCQQCSGPITDSSWVANLPPDFHRNPNYATNFCSLQCLTAFCRPVADSTLQCCDCCGRGMTKECASTKRELPCGHVCHFSKCLFSCLAEQSENFTKKVPFTCPKCRVEIPETVILEMFGGKKQFCEMQNRSQQKGCHSCGSKKTVRRLECVHKICQKCLSDVLGGGIKFCALCYKAFKISLD